MTRTVAMFTSLFNFCLCAGVAFALDGGAAPQDKEKEKPSINEEFLRSAMEDAQKEYAAELQARNIPNEESGDTPAPSDTESVEPLSLPRDESLGAKTDELLESLVEEVHSLRTKAVVVKSAALSLQNPLKVRVKGSRTVYNFRDDSVYEIFAGVDHVTDVQLEPGEALTASPSAGDTVRWSIGVMTSGQGGSGKTHLILKPLDTDLETNMIVTTDRRVYHLRVKSGDFHMPVVSWNYPKDSSAEIEALLKREKEEQVGVPPEQLSFDYDIEENSYPWSPLRVFDDGQKTYFQMPKKMRVNEAPALFLIDDEEDEPLLVNYRVKGEFFIVDRLFEEAEFRVGAEKRVRIRSGDYRPGFLERLFN